ncbi:hypothetical protein L218DRAFT_299276 [Marasmius fiardii PR-910]|nr:hypothetical protein L218DRAFT_299276 [Marasmius fiardii PR-910]
MESVVGSNHYPQSLFFCRNPLLQSSPLVDTQNLDSQKMAAQQADSPCLKAGYSFNNEERHGLNQLLEEGTRRLQNDEDEIIQLRQRLTMREEAKQALEITIAKLHFALEIWPRVPTEIWRNIFAMVFVTNP